MAAEKKIRGDLEECRQQIKKMSETNKEAVKKLADEDATRRIKQLDDQVETLRKQVTGRVDMHNRSRKGGSIVKDRLCRIRFYASSI